MIQMFTGQKVTDINCLKVRDKRVNNKKVKKIARSRIKEIQN